MQQSHIGPRAVLDLCDLVDHVSEELQKTILLCPREVQPFIVGRLRQMSSAVEMLRADIVTKRPNTHASRC